MKVNIDIELRYNTFSRNYNHRCNFTVVEAVLTHTSLQYTVRKINHTYFSYQENMPACNSNQKDFAWRETDLWIKLRPRVPMTTATGFTLSASLHIAWPASPSTILASDLTYLEKDFLLSLQARNRIKLSFYNVNNGF